jgi:hypothetical protein
MQAQPIFEYVEQATQSLRKADVLKVRAELCA